MTYALNQIEATQIRALANSLQLQYGRIDNEQFWCNLYDYVFDLPISLISALQAFKNRDIACFRVNGLIVHEDLLGATPNSWRDKKNREVLTCEFMHYIIAIHIGQPFCWLSQQDGRIMNDILPMAGFEHEQLAIASQSHLKWHVEDAFHDARGEFLSLMCLRNHDRTPTLLSSPNLSKLSKDALDELFTEQYFIRADDAHIVTNGVYSSIEAEQDMRGGGGCAATGFASSENCYFIWTP